MALKFRSLAVLTCALLLAACSAPSHGATHPVGGTRPVTVRTPPGYSDGKPAPLLIVLHGFDSSPDAVDDFLHLASAAAKAGMIYAAPEGSKDAEGKRFWNASPACCDTGHANVDDSAYLHSVISDIADGYAVDTRRIFVVGHSNGGFMAHRLACDHANDVAAIVSAAGAGFADAAACKPSKPVAVLQIHGDADPVVSYPGGKLAAPYPGAAQTVRDWAQRDGCSLTAAKGKPLDLAARAEHAFPESAQLPGAETVTESYGTGCRAGGYAALWTVGRGGHAPELSADGPARIVDFLLAHPKP